MGASSPERQYAVNMSTTHLAYRSLMADVYELAGRSRAASDALAAELGVTTAQWHVMSVVHDEPATVPQIAARLGLARQSVQRVVDDLVAAGLVERRANARHRRSALLALTSTGTRTTDRLFAASRPQREAQLAAAGVDLEALVAAQETLRRLLGALDQPATPARSSTTASAASVSASPPRTKGAP